MKPRPPLLKGVSIGATGANGPTKKASQTSGEPSATWRQITSGKTPSPAATDATTKKDISDQQYTAATPVATADTTVSKTLCIAVQDQRLATLLGTHAKAWQLPSGEPLTIQIIATETDSPDAARIATYLASIGFDRASLEEAFPDIHFNWSDT